MKIPSIMAAVGIVFMACTHKKVETRYPDGTIMETYEVNKEGQKDGKYIAYFENGTVRETAQYTKGVLTGPRTIFHPTGKPETEELRNQEGALDGAFRVYYPQGGVMLEKTYTNDKITGILKAYYPSGKIKEEVSMVENEENGPFTEYYMNGAIHWKGTYRNGDNEYGLLHEYDSLGGTIKVMKCDTIGICRTIWKPGMPEIKLDTVKI